MLIILRISIKKQNNNLNELVLLLKIIYGKILIYEYYNYLKLRKCIYYLR